MKTKTRWSEKVGRTRSLSVNLYDLVVVTPLGMVLVDRSDPRDPSYDVWTSFDIFHNGRLFTYLFEGKRYTDRGAATVAHRLIKELKG